jgi:hypothetical protein
MTRSTHTRLQHNATQRNTKQHKATQRSAMVIYRTKISVAVASHIPNTQHVSAPLCGDQSLEREGKLALVGGNGHCSPAAAHQRHEHCIAVGAKSMAFGVG